MNADETAAEQSLPHRIAQLQTDISAVRREAIDLEQQARTVIQQRPVVAVMVAASAGYLLGRLVARGIR